MKAVAFFAICFAGGLVFGLLWNAFEKNAKCEQAGGIYVRPFMSFGGYVCIKGAK